ncbi:MAG: 4Fe-4S binding protein [Phycisphaerae bacterium]|nr:4Fe-4S binding protein [Phycisphaerae bacterium]
MTEFQQIERKQITFGGKPVPVAVVHPLDRASKAPSVLKGLVRGMRLTLGYFLRPWKVVTRQYPENRQTLRFPQRYRAMLTMIHDSQGFHRCTACKLCEKACPNGSIRVITQKGLLEGVNKLDQYIWRMDSCLLCNACVQACPFGALKMTHSFENAVYDRRLLVYNLNRYAGPPAKVLAAEPDTAKRRQMMEPRGRFDGPLPLNEGLKPVLAKTQESPVRETSA